MFPYETTWTQQRARIAALTRSRQPDDPELLEARSSLREIRLAEHIQKVVSAAPPLTNEQRERLAVLLRPIPAIGGGRVA